MPLTEMDPESDGKTPERIFTNVLLPAPFAPSRAWISPDLTVRSADRIATTEPNRFAIPPAASKVWLASDTSDPQRKGLGVGLPKEPDTWFMLVHSPGPLQSMTACGSVYVTYGSITM